jgi:hypothetical protein
MLQFFYNTAPNPMKVTLLLEELEITYEAIPVDTRKGQQFEPKFLAITPMGKSQQLSMDLYPYLIATQYCSTWQIENKNLSLQI